MPAGRPRNFDKSGALEAAMRTFWQNGYAATSMADLTEAMAINKPSLYAAFGNKEQLFVTALQSYLAQYRGYIMEKLVEPGLPLEQRLRNHLMEIATVYCREDLPAGCMLANSTFESASEHLPDSIRELVSELNDQGKNLFIDFFAAEQAQGNIKQTSSPTALALHLMSVASGMAVLSRHGTSCSELYGMVDHVVASLTQ